MDAVANLRHHSHHLLTLSPPHRRLSAPISSLSFSSPSPRRLSLSIRASSSSPSPSPHRNPNPPQFSLLKTTLVAGVAAAAVFFSRLAFPISAPFTAPPHPAIAAAESADDVNVGTDDVVELKGMMEAMIKEGKMEEAVGVVERIIRLEPDDMEWPLMKAHLLLNIGNLETARLGFDEILQKDPTSVDAYHGLIMAASEGEGDSVEQLKNIGKRVQEAMEICKRDNTKKNDLRDFKLLIAQIRVIEGDYNEALKVYEELVKEEPRDFRPYLCQGIIYTLLKKTDEAEKQFEKYRRLVPKGHPYAQFFDDNMIATKVFGQKMENERAATRN